MITAALSQGFRNDLKAAMDKLDQQHLQDLGIGQEKGEMEAQNDLRIPEEFSTIEELRVSSPNLARVLDGPTCPLKVANLDTISKYH